MRRPSRTSWFAAGIYKKLAVLFPGELFKHLEVIVEIIVHNYDAVILFKLLLQSFGIGDTLAGGACELILGVCPSYVFLQQGRHYYRLVETVVRKVHDHVAEIVAEVFLLQCGVGESESKGDASVIESLYDASYEVLVTDSALSSSAVPYGRREHTVE